MKRFGSRLLLGLALAVGLAAAAVAMPVDVLPAFSGLASSVTPQDVATGGAMLAFGALAVPAAKPDAAMRAKFVVSSITQLQGAEKVLFHAVSKPGGYPDDGLDEDNTFAKWSPSASCEIMITNTALHGSFKPGEKYYVDFTAAPA